MDNPIESEGLDQNRFSDIPVELTISVGHAKPTIKELLSLEENAVLQLDRKIEDPVELYIGDRLVARGALEELEGGEPGQLAVRLTEVVALAQGGI